MKKESKFEVVRDYDVVKMYVRRTQLLQQDSLTKVEKAEVEEIEKRLDREVSKASQELRDDVIKALAKVRR